MPMLLEPYWNWLKLPHPAAEPPCEEGGSATKTPAPDTPPSDESAADSDTAAPPRGLHAESSGTEGPA